MTQQSFVRTFEDLVETVRAIARLFETDKVFIIGSQSILLSWPDAPVILRTSGEIDAYPENARLSIEDFFKLERTVTFKLSALLGDANELHKIIVNPSVDISGFVGRMSRAFLPSAVYHLEEYGLPRMISKKIHAAGLINFEDPEMDLIRSLERFQSLGTNAVLGIKSLGPFDRYVVRFFFDGITPDELQTPEDA